MSDLVNRALFVAVTPIPDTDPARRGPPPIDMAAARRVAEAMRVTLSEACRAAGVPDDSGWLTEFTRPDFDGFQDFVTGLRDDADPDHVPLIPELCARLLGDDARTDRALLGDQEIREPFFHAVHTDGEMSVGGDLGAEAVYGYYNDQTLQARTIRARPVIEDEHSTIAGVEADTHFDLDDFQQGYGEGVQERLREVLVDEVFSNEEDEEEEEQLDRTLLFARLREGQPVFRTDEGAAAH
ncbi:hypothetical protein [Streptomyces sp. NPDC006510]|uniref:hypothetical protein n=1 Tax=Streptomyces sp. NPDC006510 TaxID=3155600 RepID=UPI0033A24AA4